MAWHWADQGAPPDLTVEVGAVGALTVQDSPDAAGRPYAFVRGSDGHLWVNWWDGSAWAWADQGAPPDLTVEVGAVGALTVQDSPDAAGRPYAFVRGSDGHLWVNWWDGSAWAWADQGAPPDLTVEVGAVGALTVQDSPDAAGRPYAFVRGSDGHLWVNWWDGSAWAWADQGAPPDLTVEVGAVGALTVQDSPDAAGRPYAFVRGSDGHLWVNWWDGSAWAWADQGAPPDLTVEVGAVGALTVQDSPDAAGRPYAFVRGSDGHLWVNWWDGSAWAWADQGAPPDLTVEVGAVGALTVQDSPDAAGRPYAFVRGSDGHLWVNWWDGSAWAWADQGAPPDLTVEVGAVGALTVQDSPDAAGRPYAFVRGSDSRLWVNWWSQPETSLFVRREIWQLESNGAFDPITLAYANAVKVMQARPASNPTSWTFQAAIHGTYATPPAGADWNQCQHQGWFFLPWHRMYLYFFERIVRAAVTTAGGPADFAIPYWNYDKPFPGNTIPLGFRTQTLPDGSANPLFLASPRRRASLMTGGQLNPLITSPANALAQTNFTSPAMGFGGGKVGPQHFGNFANTGALEQTPHNDIHVALVGANPIGQCQGGFMIDPNCAALDPIFWLHHSNIDRLWNVWLASGGGRVNPPDSSWRTAPFVFYDETGAEVTMTGEQVLDSANQLGYVYDDVPSFEMASLPPEGVPEPAGPPELAAATDESFTLAGASASVALSVPASTQELVGSALGRRSGRVLISVDDIKADTNPGVVYGVYLNLPDEDGDRQRHHIGNVSLFGIEKMNDPDTRHDGAPGFRHIFDATGVARELSEEGLWDPARITVTFEPIEVSPPPGEEDTWDAGETPDAAIPPIEIGRVSLFVA